MSDDTHTHLEQTRRLPKTYVAVKDARHVRCEEYPGDEPVTFDVWCGKTETNGYTHPVTLYPDWTLDTGHDFALERIATALGGSAPSCLDLIDKGIPAIRMWRGYCRRLVGVPLRSGGRNGTQFLVDKSVPHCQGCAHGGWDTVDKAMAHLRTLMHWACVYDFPLEQAERIWHDMVETGSWWDEVEPTWAPDLGWPDTNLRLFAMRSSPMPPAEFAELGFGRYEAQRLWDAGVHPAWASGIIEALGMDELIWEGTLIRIAGRHIPIECLAQFASQGPARVDWAARQYTSFDKTNSTVRMAWLDAGVGPGVIDRLLTGPYTTQDVAVAADIMLTSVNSAGVYLADWLDAGCEPTVKQVERIFERSMSLRVAPSAAMIAKLRRDAKLDEDAWPTNDLGIILAACGTVASAGAYLKSANLPKLLDELSIGRVRGKGNGCVES